MSSPALTATTAPTSRPGTEPDSGLSGGPAWGALVLLVLGALALFFSRRRRGLVRRMEVLETMSLGPRRSLCLARVDGRTLVLGVSEAGVQLLTSHDSPAPATDTFDLMLGQSVAEQELRAARKATFQGPSS